MPFANIPKQLDCRDDARAVLAVDTDFPIFVSTDRDVHRVVITPKGLNAHIPFAVADAGGKLHVDAGRQNHLKILLQRCLRQAEPRNPEAEHPAQFAALFVDGHAVAHEPQEVSRGHPAGAAADNGHPPAGVGLNCRCRHHAGLFVGKTLEAADIDGLVNHVAAAPRFARVFADNAAGRAERVVLAHQAHGVRVAARVHQRDVARNIDACRAEGHAGHRLIQLFDAAVPFDVAFEIVPEAVETAKDHVGRLVADRTVGGFVNHSGRLFQDFDAFHAPLTVENVVHDVHHLPDADPAGHALAAGLGVAHSQKGRRNIHRAEPRRTRDNPLL